MGERGEGLEEFCGGTYRPRFVCGSLMNDLPGCTSLSFFLITT